MPDSTSREIVPEMDRYLNWIHSGSGKESSKSHGQSSYPAHFCLSCRKDIVCNLDISTLGGILYASDPQI